MIIDKFNELLNSSSNDVWILFWIGNVRFDFEKGYFLITIFFRHRSSRKISSIEIPANLFPLLSIGSEWKNGEKSEKNILSRYKININTKFLKSDEIVDYFPKDISNQISSNKISLWKEREDLKSNDVDLILIPQFEIMRFYFFKSSKLTNCILEGGISKFASNSFSLRRNLYVIEDSYLEDRKGILFVRHGFESPINAKIIARIAFEPLAQKSINLLTNRIRESHYQNKPEKINGLFPFEGESEIQFYGSKYTVNGKKILIVCKIISCSFPFPFDELDYNSDKDTRKGNDENAKERKDKKPKQSQGKSDNNSTDTQNPPDDKYIKEEEIIDSEDLSPHRPIIRRVPKLEQKTKGGRRNDNESPAKGNAPAQEKGQSTGNIPKEFTEDEDIEPSNFRSEDFEKTINDLFKILEGPKSLEYIELSGKQLKKHNSRFSHFFPSKFCVKFPKFRYTRIRKIEKDDLKKYIRSFCIAMIISNNSHFYFFEVEPNFKTQRCFAAVKKPISSNKLNLNEISILLIELAGEKGIWQNVHLDNLDVKGFKHFLKKESSDMNYQANYTRYLQRIKKYLLS